MHPSIHAQSPHPSVSPCIHPSIRPPAVIIIVAIITFEIITIIIVVFGVIITAISHVRPVVVTRLVVTASNVAIILMKAFGRRSVSRSVGQLVSRVPLVFVSCPSLTLTAVVLLSISIDRLHELDIC